MRTFGLQLTQFPHFVHSSSLINTFSEIQQRIKSLSNKSTTIGLCKSLIISTIFMFIIYLFWSFHLCCQTSTLVLANLNLKWSNNNIPYPNTQYKSSPTNITHLMFGIVGSSNTWGGKKNYIESWWRPNRTRGFLFLDRAPIEHLPWPPSSPPVCISESTSRYNPYNKHPMPFAIRMVRVIEETFKAKNRGVRWYVMADDDTIFFTGNLVEVLSRYDHNKYYYIGMNSECVLSNGYNSFGMAFGGAGYALSYPLAEALSKNLDGCIKRYPTLYGSDHILQSCVADLGVSLTLEKGFHQIDLHRDISGLLSAHPQSPFLSLHHLDVVDPIFPTMNRYQSVNHLMKAASADQSRLLQQTICYHKQTNWTFSVSWGYSAQIYEKIIPSSFLQIPIQTFTEWKKSRWPAFTFNTRFPSGDPCEAPHVFFLDSVEKPAGAGGINSYVVTSYVRRWPRSLPACSSSGNHTAEWVYKIRVLSPVRSLEMVGSRRECCDVVQLGGNTNVTTVKLRTCMKNEIIG